MSLYTLLLIGVTLFLATRLYSALGKFGDAPMPAPEEKTSPDHQKKVVPLAPPGAKKKGKGVEKLNKQVAHLRQQDPSFNLPDFIEGAVKAYEIIIEAFSGGNKEALSSLVSAQVLKDFEGDIDLRAKEGKTLELRMEKIKQAEVKKVEIKDQQVFITIAFKADIISIVKDEEDRIIEGDPQTPEENIDVWIFARDITSTSPNWMLVSTAG